MSEKISIFEKTPTARHPEVVASQDELQKPLEIEELAYNYKKWRDEMLSIFDEVKEYFDYAALEKMEVNNDDDEASGKKEKLSGLMSVKKYSTILTKKIKDEGKIKQLSADYERQLEAFVGIKSEIESNNDGHGTDMLFTDFQVLMDACPSIMTSLLQKGIRNKEEKSLNDSGEKIDSKQKAIIKAKVVGQLARDGYMLRLSYKHATDNLASLSEEEMEEINMFGRENYEPVKKALGAIKTRRDGMEASTASKNQEAVKSVDEVASIHNVSSEMAYDAALDMEIFAEADFGGEVTLGIEDDYDEQGNFIAKEFMPAYVNYHGEMKNLRLMLNEGKIVETKYIKDVINDAMPFLRKNPPTIVYLHGDFGTGKTAIAEHISKTRFGKKALVVAGSKFLEPERFTEEFRLAMRDNVEQLNEINQKFGLGKQVDENTSDEEVMSSFVGGRDEIRQRMMQERLRGQFEQESGIIRPENYQNHPESMREYEEEFEKWSEKKKAKIDDEIKGDIEKELDKLFENKVQGRYVLGAMYEAMKTGTPLIIDEANAISPDVLIAFNDLLTKKIGEKLAVRGDAKEIVIKEGYCVMWTGNTGERYKNARFNDVDPATYSRLHAIKVNYLPQNAKVDTGASDYMARLELDKLPEVVFDDDEAMLKFVKESKKLASSDQIFQVLITKLLNKRNGAHLMVKKDDHNSLFKDLYKLSAGARILMDMFERRAEGLPKFPGIEKIIGGSGSETELMETLEKSNLSMRELIDNIIGGYMDDGGAMDIEYYTIKFIKKYNMFPKEQAILYAVLGTVGLFNSAEGWPNWQTIANAGGTQEETLTKFKDAIGKNPIDMVNKYKKIESNGDYYSMLNTKDPKNKHVLHYFSDMEMMQLIYGYLPARRKGEYSGLSKRIKENVGDQEKETRLENLAQKLGEIVGAIDGSYFKTSGEVNIFIEEIKKFKILHLENIGKIGKDELLFETEGLCDYLLSFMETRNIISADEILAAKTIDDKVALMQKAMKK